MTKHLNAWKVGWDGICYRTDKKGRVVAATGFGVIPLKDIDEELEARGYSLDHSNKLEE